ncbi:MAG: ABC transporter ATP-binding protein [Alphaproteobacteria bacterium]
MISLFNVTRYHMGKQEPQIILNNVTVQFGPSDKVGILALGGAGKSTLARILAGTERPNKGIVHRGNSLSFPIGTTAGFHPKLSGAENIRHLSRLLRRNIAETVDYCESFADIGAAFHRPVGQYAPGMRARLAFAFSMSVEFDTYLSDGIISAGDHGFRDKCEAALHERLSRSGLILLSRHARTLNRFCTRFYALHAGQLLPCETAEEAQDLLDYAGEYGNTYWNEAARHA